MKLTALTFLVLSIAFPVGNLATKLQHPRKKLPNSRVPWNEGVAPLTASSPMKKGRRRGFGTHHRGSVSSDARNLESTAATAFQTWPWHERGLRALSKSSSSGWERPACCSGGLSAIKMQYTGPNGTTLSLPGADLQEDGASSHVIGPCGETMKDFKDGYESVRFVNCTSCFPSGTASSGCETASDSWGTILVNNQDFVCLISVHDDATVALEEKLPTDVQVLYQPSGNSNLNTVAIHTSCSKVKLPFTKKAMLRYPSVPHLIHRFSPFILHMQFSSTSVKILTLTYRWVMLIQQTCCRSCSWTVSPQRLKFSSLVQCANLMMSPLERIIAAKVASVS